MRRDLHEQMHSAGTCGKGSVPALRTLVRDEIGRGHSGRLEANPTLGRRDGFAVGIDGAIGELGGNIFGELGP